MINMLKSSYTVCAMVSEEDENMIEVELGKQGIYFEFVGEYRFLLKESTL